MMLGSSALSNASSRQQLGPQIRFLTKPAGDRCVNQGESVERQAVGSRVVDEKYPRAEEAFSLSGKNGCNASWQAPVVAR